MNHILFLWCWITSDTPYKFETTKNGFRIYDIDE